MVTTRLVVLRRSISSETLHPRIVQTVQMLAKTSVFSIRAIARPPEIQPDSGSEIPKRKKSLADWSSKRWTTSAGHELDRRVTNYRKHQLKDGGQDSLCVAHVESTVRVTIGQTTPTLLRLRRQDRR